MMFLFGDVARKKKNVQRDRAAILVRRGHDGAGCLAGMRLTILAFFPISDRAGGQKAFRRPRSRFHQVGIVRRDC